MNLFHVIIYTHRFEILLMENYCSFSQYVIVPITAILEEHIRCEYHHHNGIDYHFCVI